MTTATLYTGVEDVPRVADAGNVIVVNIGLCAVTIYACQLDAWISELQKVRAQIKEKPDVG